MRNKMTEEEITHYNITIAVFMGGQFKDSNFDRFVFNKELNGKQIWKVFPIKRLKYHNSWDWLLPAYKKLSQTLSELKDKISKSHKSNIDKHAILKHIDDCDCVIRCEIWGVRIDDAFKGIAETIKLYNEKFSKYEKKTNTTN